MTTETAATTPYEQAQRDSIADPGRCSVRWGVCPEHGPTLCSSGGRTWCRHPQCPRTWDYDRVTAPCRERATHTVLVYTGDLRPAIDGRYVVCDGHAIGAEACVDVRVILGT